MTPALRALARTRQRARPSLRGKCGPSKISAPHAVKTLTRLPRNVELERSDHETRESSCNKVNLSGSFFSRATTPGSRSSNP